MSMLIVPDWPAPKNVLAYCTTRVGGVSEGPYASLNLADHVGDSSRNVATNRLRLRSAAALPDEPSWLVQVHGRQCVDIGQVRAGTEADACVARRPNAVCAVLTADCLPLLFSDTRGTVVAAAHAGWRGLASGVIESTIVSMRIPSDQLLVWLGPAIGPEAFEVGDDVYRAFVTGDPGAASAFKSRSACKWLCDIYELARRRLNRLGVCHVYGGGECTVSDPGRFYSFRRDGASGRMASLIWLDSHV